MRNAQEEIGIVPKVPLNIVYELDTFQMAVVYSQAVIEAGDALARQPRHQRAT